MNSIEFAISPCPNDTFIFYGWKAGKVKSDWKLSLQMADIEELNRSALSKKAPFIKASIALIPEIFKDYTLLPVGCALGYGCGPKVISKCPINPSDLQDKTVLIPGKNTTAHSLFKTLFPECTKKIFCSYDEIFEKLNKGEADCGVIIHESRFTFQASHFIELADLGELWTSKTELPIPLGGFFAKRSLPKEIIEGVIHTLRLSLNYSWKFPEEALNFMLSYSQEKDSEVIMQHVNLYVTQETYTLSPVGLKAIESLINFSYHQFYYEKVCNEEAPSLCPIL